MGVFADWQPAYAEAGVATFPMDGKKPRVANYQKAGVNASAQWARKFGDSDAFGFLCGKNSRLTVLDIDEPDETLLADSLDVFGASPVVVRTASGKFHVWYRFNGEKREIRCSHIPGRAIDILGGGVATAPPSKGASGTYEFIEGSLADVSNLSPMRIPKSDNGLPPAAAQDASSSVGEGTRNKSLFCACMRKARTCDSLDSLLWFAQDLNANGQWLPLPDDEVRDTVTSAWRYESEGRNRFEGDKHVVIYQPEHEILMASPDACYLFQKLRFEHWDRDFFIANNWANCLPISRARLQSARKFLLDHNLIELVRRHTKGSPAVYRFPGF